MLLASRQEKAARRDLSAQGGVGLTSSISNRIRSARTDRGLSQTELSKLLGVNRATVGHWERSESFAPNLQHLHSLSLALDVTIDWLTGGDEESSPVASSRGSRYHLEGRMLELSKHLPVSFLASVVALLEKAELYL
ncbi:helix-turn-helix domain-containing protein [Xanthomonas campestris pv. raphani]|uniref:helix-turn-helix domain-containing protein n=1 Tax=Xanthomonas TaxID=338 RepID=UPI000A0468C5|nr:MULTISPECIES: helix-turn-helix domain-containing protein [Xanthomonas]MEA9746053.1 helix-turn-helix domain-containing protein [Xanthomonas campestris pv. raphani]MEA9846552.1 helix-turn-helix domain-containing protein [Xanthomonas campestris pv. raphani]MEA9928192.1 helix-turn-helix domain-containing protein [Xanthomonas campestris pv. raphani]UTS71654.1 helix-turn-helix domain-containing protein [Xanthomonas hortorum]